MRHYIKEIISIISNQIERNSSQTYLFRLDHFNDPTIYLEVCRYFFKYTDQSKLNFNAKLSSESYAMFNEEGYIEVLNNLKEEHYFDETAEMTKWRNSVADEKGIVFLMGTENVKDRGGLADFFVINPSIVESHIGNKYHKWFVDLIEVGEEYERNAIDHFLNALFRVSPKDLYKLSCTIDELKEIDIYDVEDVLKYFGTKLYENWGIPNILTWHSREITNLKRKKKFDLVDKAHSFGNRSLLGGSYNKSTIKKMKDKLLAFPFDYSSEEAIQRINEYFGSYEIFNEDMNKYFSGNDLEITKVKLFNFDFAIINQILNLKISTGDPKEKTFKEKVYGSPIQAFSKIIVSCVRQYKEKFNNTVGELDFQIQFHLFHFG